MKCTLFFLFVSTISLRCLAQSNDIHFSNEVGFKYEFESTLMNTKLKPVNFDSTKFQARIWYINTLSPIEVIVLSLAHNEWSIHRYELVYSSKVDTVLLLERHMNPEIDLYELWKQLVNNQILTLVDYHQLEFEYERDGKILKFNSANFDTGLSDGTLYKIELLTKSNKRKYSYRGPHSFKHIFNTDVIEITQILNIIDLFDEAKK